jgi:cell division septum initiation protein DivIVA
MESLLHTPTLESPVQGYPRSAVDEFVAAAEAEAAKLEAMIADAGERTRRSRAAIGTHRVMVAMLLEAQRELDEIRALAEAEAADIIATAEREADEVLKRNGHRVVDLSELERGERSAPRRSAESPVKAPMTEKPTVASSDPGALGSVPHAEGPDDGADYFDFLRGALVDDEPLGPRGE